MAAPLGDHSQRALRHHALIVEPTPSADVAVLMRERVARKANSLPIDAHALGSAPRSSSRRANGSSFLPELYVTTQLTSEIGDVAITPQRRERGLLPEMIPF